MEGFLDGHCNSTGGSLDPPVDVVDDLVERVSAPLLCRMMDGLFLVLGLREN